MSQSTSASQQGTYTPTEGTEMAELSDNSTTPGHLVAAADYIAQIFRANNVNFAIMGGFSLMVRGSERETHDVDVAVGCNMQQLIQVLSPQPRILRPAGPVAGACRIFVKTGEKGDEDLPELWTKVDLILRGSLGAPDDPQSNSEPIMLDFDGVKKEYPVLNLTAIMASKLGAHFARGEKNDMNDILYIIQRFPEELYGIKSQLNATHRQGFVDAMVQQAASQGLIKKAKLTLGVA